MEPVSDFASLPPLSQPLATTNLLSCRSLWNCLFGTFRVTRTLCCVAFHVCLLLRARCFQGSSVLCPGSVLHAFLWPNDISLCGQSALGLSTYEFCFCEHACACIFLDNFTYSLTFGLVAARAFLSSCARASHCGGFSCCGARRL